MDLFEYAEILSDSDEESVPFNDFADVGNTDLGQDLRGFNVPEFALGNSNQNFYDFENDLVEFSNTNRPYLPYFEEDTH